MKRKLGIIRGAAAVLAALTMLVGCGSSNVKSERTPSTQATSRSPAPTTPSPSGTNDATAGLDGLWEEFAYHPGNTGMGIADSDVGPILGSPLKATTVGTTTTLTLTQPTPYGRCDGQSGKVAPAGTIVGTFTPSGAGYKGKVMYWGWRKCSPAGSYNWTLTPDSHANDANDGEPDLMARGDGFDLWIEIHRCPGGVKVPTVDPITHASCHT